jgi:hypothetical protein
VNSRDRGIKTHSHIHGVIVVGLNVGKVNLERIISLNINGLRIDLAERVGFEPTEGLTLRRFSRPVP